MKKEQFLMMMAILFSIGLKAQSTYTMDDKWYNIYAYMYYMQDDPGLQSCDEPKHIYSQLQKQSYEQKAVQLLHFNFPLDSTADADMAAFAEYGNIHKDAVSISGVSLFMPSTKILRDDCTLTIQFPADQLIECEQYYWNLPKYQLYEYNQYKKVNAITIMHDGKPLVTDLTPGGSFEIDLHDIYRKNLNMKVRYNNGEVIDYVFRMDASKYDWGLCGPPPVGDPVNPDDWPPGDGDPEPPGDDIVCCPGPPGPPPPPDFDEDCLYQPDEIWEVVAEIEYKDDHPYYQTGGFFNPVYQDYNLYGNSSNPAVYEGEAGGPMDKKYEGVIDASIYLKPGRTKVEYPIIITDGIDFTSDRTSAVNLQQMGGNAILQKFFDGGYDVIMVDYKGGADFMQKNAFAVIELIRRLRQDEGVAVIPALIGPSMGGQICRYGLLYWEQNLMSTYGPYNIETFLSADSPWKGANASPAIQCAARLFANQEEKLLLIDKMANAPAARQLLLHQTHGLNEDTGIYHGIQHPFKTDFDAELLSMGDFPKDTKIVAIADGGNGGSASYQSYGDFPGIGESILKYFKTESIIDVECDMNDIEVGQKLVDFRIFVAGFQVNDLTENFLLSQRGLKEVQTASVTTTGLDHAPGSPFRLKEAIGGLGLGGTQIENTFNFIPTFSALGISTNDINVDVNDPAVQSPYFSEIFVDNVDSPHNDFQQNGSLDFFLEQIGYQSGYDLGVCAFLEQSILDDGSQFLPSDAIQFDITYTTIGNDWDVDINESSHCQKDLRLYDDDNIVVSPSISSFNVTSDDCGLNPQWDFVNNELIVSPIPPDDDELSCTVTAELCYTHAVCPEVDICQDIEIYAALDPGLNSPKGNPTVMDVADEIRKEETQPGVLIFPNPSRSKLLIQLREGEKLIEIFDVKGTSVFNEKTLQTQLDLELKSGTYLLRVLNITDRTANIEKIVVL